MECPVCYESVGARSTTLGCGHEFCDSCAIQWYEQADGQASCPMCRSAVQYRDVHRANVKCAKGAVDKHLADMTDIYIEQLYVLFKGTCDTSGLNHIIYMQLLRNFQLKLVRAPPVVMTLDAQNGMWFVSSLNQHKSLHGRRIKGGAWSTMHTLPSWPVARLL